MFKIPHFKIGRKFVSETFRKRIAKRHQLKHNFISRYFRGGSRISQKEHQPKRGRRQSIIWLNFQENCKNMKKFRPRQKETRNQNLFM